MRVVCWNPSQLRWVARVCPDLTLNGASDGVETARPPGLQHTGSRKSHSLSHNAGVEPFHPPCAFSIAALRQVSQLELNLYGSFPPAASPSREFAESYNSRPPPDFSAVRLDTHALHFPSVRAPKSNEPAPPPAPHARPRSSARPHQSQGRSSQPCAGAPDTARRD